MKKANQSTKSIETQQGKTLYFKFIVGLEQREHPLFSLDPKDSDLATNQLILNAIVGTLVKYGNSGRLEPYLAKAIDTTADQLRWTFKLRPNLLCQDGSKINAYSYKRILERQLRSYIAKGSVLEFEKLTNWASFLANKDFDGIVAEDELTLNFNFVSKPNQLLDFLRMPYFGYWCESNFELNQFTSQSNFIASGAFEVINNRDNKLLELSLRKNWFSSQSDSPKKIIFSSVIKDEIQNDKDNTIIHLGVNTPEASLEKDFHFIFGVPTLLTSLVISPTRNGFFKQKENRQYLFSKLFEADFVPFSKNRIRAHGFIVGNEAKIIPNKGSRQPKANSLTMKFAIGTMLADEDITPIKNQIIAAFPGAKVEFSYPDKTKKDWRDRLLSNSEFDGRIATVDAGGSFLNTSIKMIFCSDLGVKYPDPSGRICSLAEKYLYLEKEVDSNYVNKFNEILADDACVIPIYFGSISWIVSKNIDKETLPPSALYIQFEKIKFND